MADRPIIFSRPMIHALLAGRKTQTRRVLRNVPPQPKAECHELHTQKHPEPYLDAYNKTENWCWWQVDDRCCQPLFSVRYAAGDRLWVRETWAEYPEGVDFAADLAEVSLKQAGPWRSPIHLPRAYSRLTLTVTQVRVQRLQDISEEDAMAEGVLYVPGHGDIQPADLHEGYSNYLNCRMGFETLWNSLHGPDAWDANPWVAAITFTVAQRNIDEEPA